MYVCVLFLQFSRYDLMKDVIMGLGSFQVTVQLMNDTVPLPFNYSISSQEVVVVEVSLNASSEQMKLIVNKCWATSSPNPADIFSYTFLDNRSGFLSLFLAVSVISITLSISVLGL